MNTIRPILTCILAISASAMLVACKCPLAPAPQKVSLSLAKPASPAKTPSSAGFIQRWMILEPIPSSGLTDTIVQKMVKTEYFPNQLGVFPHDGDSVNVAGTNLLWHSVDTTRYNVDLYQFAHAFNKPSSDVLFWAWTVIDSPVEIQDARLAIGSNAASVWWFNGQEVIDIYGDRQAVIDDGVSPRLTLKKGANVIRCAIVNGGGATDFCARILDANGKPVTNLKISLAEPGK